MIHSWVGMACLLVFVLSYTVVIFEDKLHIRKAKPVMASASIIWLLIAFYALQHGQLEQVEHHLQRDFLEYAELFFFLLVAMTYINAMLERGVFDALRDWLVGHGFGYRAIFWLTGVMAFFLSPIIDNLTTALVLCAVVLAIGNDKPKFITLSCINIVVAANSGGAFSPFGDITTLMVWQKGIVQFWDFFNLIIPSLSNFLVPALIMNFALPSGKPSSKHHVETAIKQGGIVITGLFAATIATTVSVHHFFHLPPVFGMMTGLAYLKLYGFYLRRTASNWSGEFESPPGSEENPFSFDVFDKIARAEWDTLFFFYGVILSVGGLGYLGYLDFASAYLYGELGNTTANVLVGVLSAIVDNIPVMFAVLTMNPDMPMQQWLLVTLTAGVGGSLLSIGSAAGVALMGQARGYYTFFGHLKWTPVIALGYAISIALHLYING
jgi:Na+/H+ antiporter NhaD/arsenite permease-like protein